MPAGPAARFSDPVMHAAPPTLAGGSGSQNVLIGGKPAWRGLPLGVDIALRDRKAETEARIRTAEAATRAAVGTPGFGAAMAAEQTIKAESGASMAVALNTAAAGARAASASGGSVDVHSCSTPMPNPPHGPGVIVDGSRTVLINGLPACRVGDTIMEALGPSNRIAQGCMTVIIGG